MSDWITTNVVSVAPGLMARLNSGIDVPIVALLHQQDRENAEYTRVVAGTLDFDGTVEPVEKPRFERPNPGGPWVHSPVVIPAPAGLFVEGKPGSSAAPIVAFKVEQGDYGSSVEVTPIAMLSDGSTVPLHETDRTAAQWVESEESDSYA